VIRLIGAVAVTHFETRLLIMRVGFLLRRQRVGGREQACPERSRRGAGGRGQGAGGQEINFTIKDDHDIFSLTPLYPYTPIPQYPYTPTPFSQHLLFLLLVNSNCHCLTLQDEFLFSTV
jgi:hypothetical protein